MGLMILMMGMLKELVQNLKEFADKSGVHDFEMPDTSTMLMNNLPGQLFSFAIALALPAAGFFGASRMHKELIMFFFGCSFFCACCQLCNCVMLAGIVTFTGPVGDKLMDEFQNCNMYTLCKVNEFPDPLQKATIDCIAASVWPQYERQFPGFGHPGSPGRCSALAYASLECDTSSPDSESFAQNPMLDPIGTDPAAEFRRLLSKPVSAFDQDWAHSVALTIDGRPRRQATVAQGRVPSMPRNPLQSCKVDVQHTQSFGHILDLLESELPTIRFISTISMLVSILTACVHCAGGFFGKQLHDEWSVQIVPPITTGVYTYTQPMAPQMMMAGGVAVMQNEMQTVPGVAVS